MITPEPLLRALTKLGYDKTPSRLESIELTLKLRNDENALRGVGEALRIADVFAVEFSEPKPSILTINLDYEDRDDIHAFCVVQGNARVTVPFCSFEFEEGDAS